MQINSRTIYFTEEFVPDVNIFLESAFSLNKIDHSFVFFIYFSIILPFSKYSGHIYGLVIYIFNLLNFYLVNQKQQTK